MLPVSGTVDIDCILFARSKSCTITVMSAAMLVSLRSWSLFLCLPLLPAVLVRLLLQLAIATMTTMMSKAVSSNRISCCSKGYSSALAGIIVIGLPWFLFLSSVSMIDIGVTACDWFNPPEFLRFKHPGNTYTPMN